MTTSLPKQVSAEQLAVYETRLSSEIVKLRNGVTQLQSDFKEDKIEIGVYANSCNTIFNAFIQKLQNLYPEAILKTLYKEHHPLEETQSNFQLEMGALQNARNNYEIDDAEFRQQVVALNEAFFVVLKRS